MNAKQLYDAAADEAMSALFDVERLAHQIAEVWGGRNKPQLTPDARDTLMVYLDRLVVAVERSKATEARASELANAAAAEYEQHGEFRELTAAHRAAPRPRG